MASFSGLRDVAGKAGFLSFLVVFGQLCALSTASDTLVTSKAFLDISIGGKPVGKLMAARAALSFAAC